MTLLRATKVEFNREYLHVTLEDKRSISTPLSWYEELLHASEDQRSNYKLLGNGLLLEWPDFDLHLDVQEMMKRLIQTI